MSDNSSANKRIARNTLFLYIRMGIVMLISLYTTRVVLRVLGVEDYGIYNVVCGFVAMFGVFNTCFSTSINRFYNYELGQKTGDGIKRVYNTAVVIQLFLAVLVVVLVEVVGVWYINNKMVIPPERLSTAKWIFQFSMISMFLTIMQAPYSAAVMAYERMDYFAFVSIFDAFIKLGFIIFLQYVSGDKLLIYGILMCIVAITNFLLYFVYCRIKFSDIRLQKGLDKPLLKSMMSFAGWSILDPISYMARDQGTNMVLNLFFGPVVNAAQGIAYQIAAAVDSFGGSFSTAFRPQIIQSYSEGQYSRTKNLMFSMSKIGFILHAMLVVPIILEINYILNLWLGPDYPSYAVGFTCLILVVKTIGALNSPISQVVSATGNIRKIKVFSAIVISSVVPIAILLFKCGLEPIYAYIALLGITMMNQTGCVIIMQQVFPYIRAKEYLKKIIVPCLVFAVLLSILPLLIKFSLAPSIWRLLLVCFMSVGSTIGLGYFIILNEVEKDLVKSFAVGFIKRFKH